MSFDRPLLCGFAAILLLAAACGDDSGSSDGGTDASLDSSVMSDSGPADTGPADTGPADAGSDASVGCTSGCGIVEIALGAVHSCARRENGEVLCWGGNQDRELGDGNTRHADCANSGVAVPFDCSPEPVVARVADVAEVATSGGRSVCARQTDGTVLCWGRKGALRPGDPDPRRLIAVEEPSWSGAAQLSDSQQHTCALLADGTVSCVWQNDGGQLGDGSSTERFAPVAVVGLTGVLELRVSTFPGSFTCARTADDVQCWGANGTGQLGDGRSDHGLCGSGVTSIDCATTPVTVTGLTNATQITAGASHACALESDGTVVCWGANAAGQLGLDLSMAFVDTPTVVPGLTGVQQVVAGANHTCVLLTDGSVKCFGFNDQGELGDGMLAGHGSTCDAGAGSADCSSTPVDVLLTEGATLLAAGQRHTCALLESGAVACWGRNNRMQLGQEDREPRATPVIIAGLD